MTAVPLSRAERVEAEFAAARAILDQWRAWIGPAADAVPRVELPENFGGGKDRHVRPSLTLIRGGVDEKGGV